MEADPDQALIERCRTGDGDALRALVEQYQAAVYAPIAQAVPDGVRAEQLAQEVFLRVNRDLPYFRGEASVRTWVLRTAADVCPAAFATTATSASSAVGTADLPPQFVIRTVGRIRRERWQREQLLDLSFNVAIALVGMATMALGWYVVDASGLSALGANTMQLFGAQLSGSVRAVAPSLPGYLAAAALLGGVLAAWWWAER
jgi:hypothetical protein